MIRKITKSGYIARRLSKQNCAFLIDNKRCDIILLISSEACIKIITRPDKMSNQRAFLNQKPRLSADSMCLRVWRLIRSLFVFR